MFEAYNDKETIQIFSHTSEEPLESIDLSSLWSKLLKSNWIDPSQGRVVIRTGEDCIYQITEHTARSLSAYLSQKEPKFDPIYWDNRFDLTEFLQGLENENSRSSHANFIWNAKSIFFPKGVPLSSLMFTPHSLITITTPFSDPQLKHSSILSVQAELIPFSKTIRNIFKMECIYEAHRLLRSDVTIVCGPISTSDLQKGWFWAVSNNDIGVEIFIARAAALKEKDLPHLRYIQKHEIIRINNLISEDKLPKLEGYSTSSAKAWCVRQYWKIFRKAVIFKNDWLSFRMRIPQLSNAIKRRISRKTEENG